MGTALAPPSNSVAIEQALMTGDLAKLTVDQRLSYYNQVCESLGLNPLTRPFDYITLNGKLTLYAKRDCADQLRKIHGVSITNLAAEQVGDLLVVRAAAVDRDGRTDESTGAVNAKSLQGEALANAMMKAETKAKRRVTLSLCGLGLLDETEVQTLREQGVASDVTYTAQRELPPPTATPQVTRRSEAAPQPTEGQMTGAAKQAKAWLESNGHDPAKHITFPQGKLLFAIQKAVGMSEEDVKEVVGMIAGVDHRNAIPKERFEEILDEIDPDGLHHKKQGQ